MPHPMAEFEQDKNRQCLILFIQADYPRETIYHLSLV